MKQTGQVSPSQVGKYQIIYTATDAYGNELTIIRYVHVVQ
ncbi:MAG: immunoglobulin-like domain-containing protein [Bacillota bacterium]